ncbi:MAG: MMPL family transporter [Streptomycetales bacterium]
MGSGRIGGLARLTAGLCGRRAKWAVLAGWLVVVVFVGPLAGRLEEVQENDPAAYLPPDAESTRVLDLEQRFRQGDMLPAVVVYARGHGITPADRGAAVADARRLTGLAGVTGQASPPMPSKDGQALALTVPLSAAEEVDLPARVGQIRAIARADAPAGLVVHVDGPAGVQADAIEVFNTIDGTLLVVTLSVVILILLLTYRSPVLWMVPVAVAGVALAAAQAANYLLAEHGGLTVSGQSAGILLVLVFGAATDYALLLVARYREELRTHTDRHEAMALALRRAGPAIVASAATVIAALMCLRAASLNSTSGLGPVAAVGIACALLAMTTLLPALLVIAPRGLFWPFVPRYGTATAELAGPWGRLGRRVARRPRAVWLGTGGALAAMALGLVTLDAQGLSNEESYRGTPDAVAGEQVLAEHFPAVAGSPVVIVGDANATGRLARAVAGTPGIATIDSTRTRGPLVRVDAALVAQPDSGAAYDTVRRVRDRAHAVPGAHAEVGGTTAVNLDVQRAAQRDWRVIIPLVLVVVLAILIVLLRSLIAPVMLVATVVLSFAAALGVSALVFTHLLGFGGADSTFPLYAFIFLVALGIDYNIFLMTRVREESVRRGTRGGMLAGLAVTGGVITSAGVVLAATFSVLTVPPLVALIEMGVAVAFGVLLDTFVVRSVLVPALGLDLGRTLWWPGRVYADTEDGR